MYLQNMRLSAPLGPLQTFLGRCAAQLFKRRCLQNWFLGLKLGSRERIFAKLGFVETTLFLFQNLEVGSLELEMGLKWWVSGAKKWPEKGVLKAARPRTTFQCECPPGPPGGLVVENNQKRGSWISQVLKGRLLGIRLSVPFKNGVRVIEPQPRQTWTRFCFALRFPYFLPRLYN